MEYSEHEEKIKGEWSYWARQLCRECKHPLYLHAVSVGDEDGNNVIVGSCNALVSRSFCNCKEFMSPDNLDYIELLAKRKGIILDDKKNEKGTEL